MWKEFKAFIAQGDVMSLAVGLIMGSAFTAIVTSLVDDIFMPIIVSLTGAADVSGWVITLGNTHIMIGNFFQAVINFLLVAVLLFFVIKGLNTLKKEEEETTEEEAVITEVDLLEEILVELKRDNASK